MTPTRRTFMQSLVAIPLALVGLRSAHAVQPLETWEPQVGREQDVALKVPLPGTMQTDWLIPRYRHLYEADYDGSRSIVCYSTNPEPDPSQHFFHYVSTLEVL